MFIVAIAILELGSVLIIWSQYGTVAEVHRHRSVIASSEPFTDNASWSLPVVPHPYQGVILRPALPTKNVADSPDSRVNSFGFYSDASPVVQKSSGTLNVAVTGGSVARQMLRDASAVFRDRLSRVPLFAGKDIAIVPLAADGYKQPQQLMTLCYLTALGAEFDIVINLDGVNEIALPVTDNIPNGVFAAFPRNWTMLTARSGNLAMLRHLGYVMHLRQQSQQRAQLFNESAFRHSATMLLVWQLLQKRDLEKIHQEMLAVAQSAQDEAVYGSLGPKQTFASTDAAYTHCADLWYQSSVSMDQLCEARGTRYFHFLQPNQYVEGMKPIGPEEKIRSISTTSPFRDPVHNHYGKLQDGGRKLDADGIAFFDLTAVFADVSQRLYRDDCCHVNAAGSEILALAICDRIAEAVSQSN